jgi:hypothetical protein
MFCAFKFSFDVDISDFLATFPKTWAKFLVTLLPDCADKKGMNYFRQKLSVFDSWVHCFCWFFWRQKSWVLMRFIEEMKNAVLKIEKLKMISR